LQTVVTYCVEADAELARLDTDSDSAARVYKELGSEDFTVVDIYSGH
jgi:hypothetical protein